MIMKERHLTKELKLFRYLHARMELQENDKQIFLKLEKGFEGERKFDIWLNKLPDESCLILNDLILKMNNSTIQIDSLMITGHTIYLFDVKYYQGDYFIESERWYLKSGTEIKNPIFQLKRCETLLRQFLQPLNLNLSLTPYLIFNHPEFTLYQASKNLPIIFPTQLISFSQKLNIKFAMLNEKHTLLADKLISMHKEESPYQRLPFYNYTMLQKGIVCARCHTFLKISRGRKIFCDHCKHGEKIEEAVIRSIDEYHYLFQDRKITTNTIHEWCNVITCKKRISRILRKNFDLIGHGRSSEYVYRIPK